MDPTKLTGYLEELLMTSMSLAALLSYLGPPEMMAIVEKQDLYLKIMIN